MSNKLQAPNATHCAWVLDSFATAFRIILAVSTDCYRHIGSPHPFYATQEHANASAVDNWASNTLEITIHWYHQWKSVTFLFLNSVPDLFFIVDLSHWTNS